MNENHLSRCGKIAIAALAIGLCAEGGCGHNDMDTMSNHSAVFDEHVFAYQAALDSHGAAVSGALDLAQIGSLETDHTSRVQPHMGAMSHELGDMMNCVGPAGERPASQPVLGDLTRLQQEEGNHRLAVAGTTDINSAYAEEIRHQSLMMGMMAEMKAHAGTMMDGRGHYNCGHHTQW